MLYVPIDLFPDRTILFVLNKQVLFELSLGGFDDPQFAIRHSVS